jgi:ampG protein
MTLAVIMFKRLGINNTDIALYTSWLYLPWVIKPLWSPLVDIVKTKRWWVISMQLLIGGGLAGVALTLPGPHAFRYALAFMWLLAFSSATHDIAADGFYMLGLDTKKQAFFVGIRNTAYRIAMLTGQGLIVMFAGWLEKTYSAKLPEEIAIPRAWSMTFYLLAALFVLLFLYHQFMLPKPASDVPVKNGNPLKAFFETFITFFQKEGIIAALAFILLFRFAESQLVKIASPFLLDHPEIGGLGLDTMQVGTIYGVVGLIALTVGGILGGIVMAKQGLKHWIWGMTIAMNLPNLVYVYLAFAHPSAMWLISSCVAVEQFGYGFGFTALTYFMMLFSKGQQQTAHYAICTGFMALGMMLPGMISGYIQELVGYQNFFLWIMLCTIPSFIAVKYIKRVTP